MRRQSVRIMTAAALVSAALLVGAGTTQAQHGHGGHGGHGGGHMGGGQMSHVHGGTFGHIHGANFGRGHGGNFGHIHGGYYGHGHGGYYGHGHGGYYGHGRGGFYRPYGFYGPGFGFYGAGFGFYRPYYGISIGTYAPYYGASPFATYPVAVPVVVGSSPGMGAGPGLATGPALTDPNLVPPLNGQAAPPSGAQPQQAPDNCAHLQLLVPPNAEVIIAGMRSTQTSTTREIVSPPLTPGTKYTYRISVRYNGADGRPVDDTRDIHVRANDWFSIDFTRPAPTTPPPAAPGVAPAPTPTR